MNTVGRYGGQKLLPDPMNAAAAAETASN